MLARMQLTATIAVALTVSIAIVERRLRPRSRGRRRAEPAGSDPPPTTRTLRCDGGQRTPGVDPVDLDDPMLTDKERVSRLIAAEGGHVRQRVIVDRTGWSKSRVSRLLSAMVDDGTVEKLRVGRENVICLEGHLPEFVRFADENPEEDSRSE